MTGMLIRGGTVIDGTGAPAFAADVRVRDGFITEIGKDLAPGSGERVFDATGCQVTPGFIESHTHYDGVMWWQKDLDPLPGYGVTTGIIGNCGFAAAPMSDKPEVRLEMIKIFSFFEDMPIGPFLDDVAWDWRTWSEYRASLEKHVKNPINFAAYVGHIALRLTVLGMEAWDRAATADEIKQMAALLDDAIQAGALGLSTNLTDYDSAFRAVPSLKADDAEFEALLDVLHRHPGTTMQVSVDTIILMTADKTVDRFARLCQNRNVRLQMAGGIPLRGLHEPIRDRMIERHEANKREGRDFWVGYSHTNFTFTVGLYKTLMFGQSGCGVWQEVVAEEDDAKKLALLRSPEWRARARESWDNLPSHKSPLHEPERIMLNNSDNDAGPVGISLTDYANQMSVHVSDALAEWFANNGLTSLVEIPPVPMPEDLLAQMLLDPMTVGNISDAGAHSQMLCGGGENMLLLAHYVRDKGLIGLEAAIHVMTGKLAEHFFLSDRGEIKVGKRADIAVFNMDEIAYRKMKKAHDVPDGKGGFTWRWTRDPAPMRLTLCNGVATFENGAATGARSGELIGPSLTLQQAAE